MIAGGASGSILNSAELYDPATGEWNATGRLNVPRSVHTATLLKDGKVLIVGGSADANHSFNGAELYDPKDERWSVISRHKSEGSDLRVAGFVYWRRMHK